MRNWKVLSAKVQVAVPSTVRYDISCRPVSLVGFQHLFFSSINPALCSMCMGQSRMRTSRCRVYFSGTLPIVRSVGEISWLTRRGSISGVWGNVMTWGNSEMRGADLPLHMLSGETPSSSYRAGGVSTLHRRQYSRSAQSDRCRP